MKNCRSSLVIWVALAAIMCFTPPAWCADSTTLTGIAGTIGPSKGVGGQFDRLMALPQIVWASGDAFNNMAWQSSVNSGLPWARCPFPGGANSVKMKKQGLSFLNGIPCMCYSLDSPAPSVTASFQTITYVPGMVVNENGNCIHATVHCNGVSSGGGSSTGLTDDEIKYVKDLYSDLQGS